MPTDFRTRSYTTTATTQTGHERTENWQCSVVPVADSAGAALHRGVLSAGENTRGGHDGGVDVARVFQSTEFLRARVKKNRESERKRFVHMEIKYYTYLHTF